MSPCPSDASLARLGAATLGQTEFVSLEKHIEACVDCQAALERLARDSVQPNHHSFARVFETPQLPDLPDLTLEEELGRGSTGIVYRAWQPELARHVAVKFLRKPAVTTHEVRDLWLKEARALSRLRNRNIVQIFQIGESGDWFYLVLELIRGGSLKDRLAKPLPPRNAAALAEAVARAAAEIHQAGLLHLDLKPSNILLDGPIDGSWEQLTPMIGDFSIARLQQEMVQPARMHSIWGTPPYMAPEQASPQFEAIGTAADVYAVGATLYELLTGRPPFMAASATETLAQVREREPVAPRQLVPSIPRDLENICLRCLQKSPKNRYASARALATDLRRFQHGQPVEARPIGMPGHVWRWCRRRPGTAILTAALVLALIGGTAGIALQWHRAEAARKDAVAGDLEAQDLLAEVIQVSPVRPGTRDRDGATIDDALQRAEAHCRNLLSKHPNDLRLRIALTKVYGGLGSHYVERGERGKAEASYRQAQTLWDALAADPKSSAECRDWLATTYFWQDGDDCSHRVEFLSQAVAIWVQLAAEAPHDLDLMHRIWECRRQMVFHITSKLGREQCLHFLESNRDRLSGLVLGNPNNRGLRRHLALTCFLLGEIYAQSQSTGNAYASWRESYSHYHSLAKDPHANFLCAIWLAISCSRLMQSTVADPYYEEAVPLLEQATERIETLLKEEPQNAWLRAVLMQGYGCLALCHAKAGQAATAEQIASGKIGALATPSDIDRLEPDVALDEAATLVSAGQCLREANLAAPALRLVRQAGGMSSRLAAYPPRKIGFLSPLSFTLMTSSALANQLGDAHLALAQAELARQTLEELIRCAPDRHGEQGELSAAWMRIGKAHWTLGDGEKAWAALLESTAIERGLFEREPSNPSYRAWLSQCYDRLVFYGSRAGKLAGAADAIAERTKLWPGDAAQLSKAADDFDALAEQMALRTHGKPSPEVQTERDRYLAESHRAREAAKATSCKLSAQR